MTSDLILIVPDIHATLAAFEDVLREHGLLPGSEPLRSDAIVIQLGDLVGKGSERDSCLDLVEELRGELGDRYIQLLGNHEWLENENGTPDSIWKQETDLQEKPVRCAGGPIAVAVEDQALGPVLITHAGLTAENWKVLGEPSVQEAASILNELVREPSGMVFTAGLIPDRESPNAAAGPLWADSAAELLPSWLEFCDSGRQMPFSQVHGHTAPWNWKLDRWEIGLPRTIIDRTEVNPGTRCCCCHLGNKQIMSIDWGYGDVVTRKRGTGTALSGTIVS